ncbi:MAG: DsbA family protein [Anaerolineales bacterium]|nr:DsbA family protein [Anaerolineales bacterium]
MPTTRPDDEIVSFKKSHLFAVLGFAAGILVGYLVWGSSLLALLAPRSTAAAESSVVSAPQTQAQLPAAPASDDIVAQRYNVPVEEHDPSLGDENAAITIIEFSDFQCPFCQRYATQTHAQLMDTYGEHIRFVYKDFPLTSIHPEAYPAALAAQCAHEQGHFWEYHDLLFSQRLELGDATYLAYAEELELDIPGFSACYEEERYLAEVQADYDFAMQLGVSSTPTFFINGIAVIGSQPFSVFAQIIDYELANQGE